MVVRIEARALSLRRVGQRVCAPCPWRELPGSVAAVTPVETRCTRADHHTRLPASRTLPLLPSSPFLRSVCTIYPPFSRCFGSIGMGTTSSEADSIFEQNFQVDQHGRRVHEARPTIPRLASSSLTRPSIRHRYPSFQQQQARATPPPPAAPTRLPQTAAIFRLPRDALERLFSTLHPASLSSLAATCSQLDGAVRSFLGFSSVVIQGPDVLSPTPSDPSPTLTRDRYLSPASSRTATASPTTSSDVPLPALNEDLHHEVPLGFPRKLAYNGSVQIGTKIYNPLLGANPSCSVLDLAPLRSDSVGGVGGSATPARLPQWVKYEVTVKTSRWSPLVAPCAAIGSAPFSSLLERV